MTMNTTIPSLNNSIIPLENLELVWHGSAGSTITTLDKYIKLTGQELSKKEAVAFQHNIKDCWTIYMMRNYIVVFLTTESFIFKKPKDIFISRIEYPEQSLWKFKLNDSEMTPFQAAAAKYFDITCEALNKENAIAYHHDKSYAESVFQMRNFVVVVVENHLDEWVCGSYIYWKPVV